MKTLTINGINFEVVTSGTKSANAIIQDITSSDLMGLYSIYKTPSVAKVRIFEEWRVWFSGIEGSGKRIGCLRGSSHSFSIGGVANIDGCKAYLYITKAHNKVVFE